MTPENLEYRCLHEAGHVVAAYAAGDSVEFVDMDSNPQGAHTRVNRANRDNFSAKKLIACGGFAVEYVLFKRKLVTNPSGQLMTPQEFMQSSMDNARIDKKMFCDAYIAEDGARWAETLDTELLDSEFKNFALHEVVPHMESRWNDVEVIARDLALKRYLSRAQIEELTSLRESRSLQI
ncbi:MAG TPA: hypothetical protein VK580_10805 [Steroidobacteraceae bacterium]|nr:hypothetical protein [Steroidobacteraceae bacterium]